MPENSLWKAWDREISFRVIARKSVLDFGNNVVLQKPPAVVSCI